MSTKGVLPMDSFRLAQYSVQAPCYVCEGGNAFDAEFCRHCQAPMALAHQAIDLKTPPLMVAAIGSADAGKTVYLGMLTDMLSHENKRMQILARGAFSVTLQQTALDSLSRCMFPPKTPNEPDRWNWVHCQVLGHKKRRPVELIMPDLSGEATLEEIEHPNSYPVIRAFLQKCTGLMIMVDGVRLGGGEQAQDFFTMKIISYLCELDGDKKKGWPNKPIAMIFTKADQSDRCFDDPAEFARRPTPGVWQQCSERLKKHKYFASGVAGACAVRQDLGGRIQVPLRIEPRGVIEPFAWLVEEMS